MKPSPKSSVSLAALFFANLVLTAVPARAEDKIFFVPNGAPQLQNAGEFLDAELSLKFKLTFTAENNAQNAPRCEIAPIREGGGKGQRPQIPLYPPIWTLRATPMGNAAN